MTIDNGEKKIRHPATYSEQFLPIFAEKLQSCARVLDPFAGTGKIAKIEAMVKEFNSWDKFDRDTQITHIIDEIQESEHKEEIVEFFKRVVDFYKYQTEEFTTVFLP